MNSLITEKKYPQPVDMYDGFGRNRPIYDVYNFPNGCIVLYKEEYLKDYFHFETWLNYDITHLSTKKTVFYTNTFLSSIKTYDSSYDAIHIQNDEKLIYLENNNTLLFKIQNLKILDFIFKKNLKIINSDLKLKVNKKMHF